MTALADLDAELRRIGSAYTGNWTYALTDIASGEHIGFGEDEVMVPASLIKVPLLVALYQAVADGRLSLGDLTQYREEHHSLGSGVLQHMTPGAQMTVRDAAVLMIIISDNAATNMCIDLVGLDYANRVWRDLGLTTTSMFRRLGERSRDMLDESGMPDGRKIWVTTAREMTGLLELIARHQAVSEEASEDMLRIMRRQDYRHELTLRLPWNELNRLPDHKTNWVAEKGGAFLNGIRASGGVFHGERGEFVMSAFCEGGMGAGSGRESEGNRLLGDLGYAAWKELAAP
jgi:beta-lactamase class A